jgi:hypothetical protein
VERIQSWNGSDMFDDPKALTYANWKDISNWLVLLWVYLPLIITFAFTILIAHAVIPSLISTRHLPAQADKLRLPLTAFAVAVVLVAAVIMGFAVNHTLSIKNIWDRFLY